MLPNKVGNDLVRLGSVVVEVNVVTRIWMQIRHEGLRILEKGASWLFENTLAFAVADDVVLLAGDGKSGTCEVGCVCGNVSIQQEGRFNRGGP